MFKFGITCITSKKVFFTVLQGIRTSTITSKGQIVIPSEMREREGFRSGQKVAIFSFDDKIEVLPIGDIDWEAERKKTRGLLRNAVDKYGLRGTKIKELTRKEKDKLAMDLLGVTPEDLKKR